MGSTTGMSFTNLTEINGTTFYDVDLRGLLGQSDDVFAPIDLIKSYNEIPPVSSMINYMANAFVNMALIKVDKVTGKEVEASDSVADILLNPNYYQSTREFIRQSKIYRELFGNEYLFAYTGAGVSKIDRVKALFTLPDSNIEIEAKTKGHYFLQSVEIFDYLYKTNKMRQPIVVNQHGIVRHSNDNAIDQANYKGVSKLRSKSINISNLRAAYEARNVIITKKGVSVIISSDQGDGTGKIPLTESATNRLMQKFNERFGLKKKQDQYLIVEQPIAVHSVEHDFSKLEIFKECSSDVEELAQGFGIPSELFLSNVTYDNKLVAEKAFYQNTIIPQAQEWIEIINNLLCVNVGWKYKASYTHLPIMQADLSSRATTISTISDALNKAVQAGFMTLVEAKAEFKKYII